MSSADTSYPSTHTTTNCPQQSSHTKHSNAYAAQQSKAKQNRPSSGGPQLDITKEEFDRISQALKKEEFRKLFIDYIEEIQDPENRKLYEKEITQIEAERGVDVVFVNPEPGFVIKTSQEGNQKCFINCAKSKHVAKPTNEIGVDKTTGKKGLHWSIPMAQAPPRDDIDNNKKICRVYDVVFNPDAIYLAEKNSAFHKCLVDTALDAVEREYEVKLDRINLKFPKMQFKGIARPTVIRTLAKNPSSEASEPHPLESIYPPKPTSETAQPKVLPTKTFVQNNNSTKSEYSTPKYIIKHRHDVDLSEYTNELDAKLNCTIPRALDVTIELPLLNSSNECQLDVTEKTIFLLSDRMGAKYRLNIELPFKVNDKEGTAKFDVDSRRLIITLPVLQKNSKEQREMHASLLHLSREDSGVESDMREDCHSNSVSPIEELNSTIAVTENNEARQDAVKPAEPEKPIKSYKFLKTDIDYQFPAKFDSNVLDNTLSIILHVRNAQEQSIQMRHNENILHVQFTTIGSGFYPTHYSFYLQLKEDVSLTTAITNVDVETWENNVILNVNLNQSAEQLSSYLAGLNDDKLQEYWVHEKWEKNYKSRQSQKSIIKKIPPSLDINIQRSDSDKSIEIEIKPRDTNEANVCYVNTTEDEEHVNSSEDVSTLGDNAKQQNLKKSNKKQKRKNKKRRSLSESACDDIKAYQQHQEQHQEQSTLPSLPGPVSMGLEHAADDADDDDDDDDDDDEESEEGSLTQRTEIMVMSPNHTISSNVNVPSQTLGIGKVNSTTQQRKQRSFSESRDSVISLSAGSATSFKGILKHYTRYGDPASSAVRRSISDSCSSIDECSSYAYSTSVDGLMMITSNCNSLPFSHSFSDIPEENVTGLSESCKKTVRFSEVIQKQVFRLDSSILGQRKKNQKRRDRKNRALQRRLSEGDSADYEDDKTVTPLQARQQPTCDQYLKSKNINNGNENNNKSKGNDKKSNGKARARLESESSSDVDNNKNTMMFEMDM